MTTLILSIAALPLLVVWALAIPATARGSLTLIRDAFGEPRRTGTFVRTSDGALAYLSHDNDR